MLTAALVIILLAPLMVYGQNPETAEKNPEAADIPGIEPPIFSFGAEFLFNLEADLHSLEAIGMVPEGMQMNFYIRGGRFEGPGIRGKVRPVGGDWFVIRNDGVGQLDVRITLETDDDALIYVHFPGLINFPKEARQSMSEGKGPLGQFRIFSHPTFRTSSEKYARLNTIFAIGVGSTGQDKVTYSFYEIK